MKILVIGAVLDRFWKGGEPELARQLIKGFKRLGNEVYCLYKRRRFYENYIAGPSPVKPSIFKFYYSRIKEINPDIDEKNLDKERSRLSYHIKDLKKAGLVISKKEGRKVKLSLSEMGKLYIQGLSIKNIRNDQNGK